MRWTHRAGGALALPLLLATLFACGGPPQAAAPPPPSVGVSEPVRRPVTVFSEATGNTRAVSSVDIRARVSGELEAMHFEPSRVVKAGKLLFEIEPYVYQANRDSAAAAIKAAEADLARAEADLERIKVAIQTDAVSKSDLDLAQATRDMAEANLLASKASMAQAELELSYTQVTTPITGQVGRNLVDVGNLVSGNERTMLTSVKQIQPIFVYFNAPEPMVLQALAVLATKPDREPGDKKGEVFVATLTDEDFPFTGVIDFVANTVDADTGTIEVRAILENSDLKLFPGLFVRVRVPIQELDEAVVVHEKAVGTDLGGRYVFVVGDGNVVEQRYLELGAVQDDGMVHVREGLDGSETYIVEGLLRARPGMPVAPQPAKTESQAG